MQTWDCVCGLRTFRKCVMHKLVRYVYWIWAWDEQCWKCIARGLLSSYRIETKSLSMKRINQTGHLLNDPPFNKYSAKGF